MKKRVTLKLKIPNNNLLVESMKTYSEAISFITEQGYQNNISNRYQLHNLTYYQAKEKLNLPSQYIINAIRISSQTLKSIKSNKGSKPKYKEYMPLDFDKRTFTFSYSKVRLTTINGRIDIPIEIPEYYNKYLDWNYQTARLIYDKRKDQTYLHITFSRDFNKVENNGEIIGIDLGINNIAVTSNKQFYNSNKIKQIKSKFRYLRSRLQSKGTKSSKRLLKKISGREKRFMRQCNHEISKEIISPLNPGDTVILEKLKGIRKIKGNKKQRYWLNSWSYYQLQKFIQYKAELKGIKVNYVNPRNTSKICSKCLSLNTKRNKSCFECLNCNYKLNADLNASYNLKLSGKNLLEKDLPKVLITKAAVNQPCIPSVDCKAILWN